MSASIGAPARHDTRPSALPFALLALAVAACGSSATSDALTAPPAPGAYHGLAQSSALGNLVLRGQVTGSHLELTVKDHLGRTGTVSGTFAFSGAQCFSGTATFGGIGSPFALVDCTMKAGRLSATVKALAAGAASPATGLAFSSLDRLTMQSADSTPVTSGGLYVQYDYDTTTAGRVPIAKANDLLMSNYVAGAMLGHLVELHVPGLSIPRDRLYASVLAHLMQEDGANMVAHPYDGTTSTIDNSGDTAILGTGGPYQLNSWYSANLTTWSNGGGTYYGLVNLIALQKAMAGFTVDDQIAYATPPAPAIFNDKYWSPLATAFWHYQNLLFIEQQNATPAYDMGDCEAALTGTVDDTYNILDMILNASYNSGASSRGDGITATEAFVALCQNVASPSTRSVVTTSLTSNTLATDAYAKAVGITSHAFADTTAAGYPFYVNYARQVRFIEDQMNGPSFGVNAYPASIKDPGTGLASTPTYDAVMVFTLSDMETVFENSMSSLYYLDATRAYVHVAASDAQAAFVKAMTAVNTGGQTYVTMTVAADRKLLFDILDAAIGNLKATLGTGNPNFTSFADTTQVQL